MTLKKKLHIIEVFSQWAEARGNCDCLFNDCLMSDGSREVISDEFEEGSKLLDEYWDSIE